MRIFDSIKKIFPRKKEPLNTPEKLEPVDAPQEESVEQPASDADKAEYAQMLETRALSESIASLIPPAMRIRAFGKPTPRFSWLSQRIMGLPSSTDPAFPEFVTLITSKKGKLFPKFLDPKKNFSLLSPFFTGAQLKRNHKEMAVVTAGYLRNGDFHALNAILNPKSYTDGVETFATLKASSLLTTQWEYHLRNAYVIYDSTESEAAVRNVKRDYTRRRIELYQKSFDGKKLNKSELQELGYPNFEKLASELKEANTQGEASLELIWQCEFAHWLLRQLFTMPFGKREQNLKALSEALATALYQKGLGPKALYYALQYNNSAAKKAEHIQAAQDFSRRPTPIGLILEACFNITASDTGQMIVMSHDNVLDLTANYSEIANYDFAPLCQEHEIVWAYIACGTSILVIEARKLNENRINFTIISPSTYENYASFNELISLAFPIGEILNEEEFDEQRSELSQRLADGEELDEEEMLMLGHTRAAHLELARAIKARNEEMLGEALYRYHLAAHLAWKAQQNGHADIRDKAILKHVPELLARIFDNKGFEEVAMGYLESLLYHSNHNLLAFRVHLLERLRDKRAQATVNSALAKQMKALKEINEGKENAVYDPRLYSFLRRAQYNALIQQRHYNEAKMKLASMHADPDPAIRAFAKDESYNLAKMGLLETQAPKEMD